MHKTNIVLTNILSGSLMLGIFAFTLFMFLNCAEILFETDIPRIGAIKTVEASQIASSIHIVNQEKSTSLYGTPQAIRIPSINTKLEMIPGALSKNGWLTRNNKAHYFFTKVNGNEENEHIFIYATKNWRTVQNPEDLKSDDNLYIDTQEWRYLYRITRVHTIDLNTPYVAPDTSGQQLILLVQDFDNQIIHIFEAEFLDLQAIF